MADERREKGPHNPMKKRFRSWQPVEEEPPRRRRRYPRLVVRDRTGNHIANNIVTAPKVELPLKPIVPKTVTIPPSPPRALANSHPVVSKQDNPFAVAHVTEDSLECSTSSRDRAAQQNESQQSLPSPSHPMPRQFIAPESRGEAYATTPYNANHVPQETVSPPIAAARVNPLPTYAKEDYPSPQYRQWQKPNAEVYYSYENPSYPTASPVRHAAAPFTPREVVYQTQPVYNIPPQHSAGHSGHIAQNMSPQCDAYHSQPTNYQDPQAAPASPPVVPCSSQQKAHSEKVILAGRRAGTVEYWRSSLQMPREKGVIKSVKAAAPLSRRRSKQETPERTYATQPPYTQQQHPHTPPAPTHPSPGYAAGCSMQQQLPPKDYENRMQIDQGVRRSASNIEHEFWRSATKLPRGAVDTARTKRLAHGKRRVDNGYLGNGQEAVPALVMKDSPNAGSPDLRRCSNDQQSGQGTVVMQTDCNPRTDGSTMTPASLPAPKESAPVQVQQTAPSRPLSSLDRNTKVKAESETRRLLFLRDFELRRIKNLAQSKFHVKMNLRGRMKLEQWVCSDEVSFSSTDAVVTMFNFDRRVLSEHEDVRRDALYAMTNDALRVLEAIMSRITSRGGRTNWSLLTTSLSREHFISPPDGDFL